MMTQITCRHMIRTLGALFLNCFRVYNSAARADISLTLLRDVVLKSSMFQQLGNSLPYLRVLESNFEPTLYHL